MEEIEGVQGICGEMMATYGYNPILTTADSEDEEFSIFKTQLQDGPGKFVLHVWNTTVTVHKFCKAQNNKVHFKT